MASKYRAVRTNGYSSKREAEYAANLAILARAGKIHFLQEQVSFDLLPAAPYPHCKRPLRYIADFSYFENGERHVVDVKGFRTKEYLIKRRLMAQLLGIVIEEV